MGKNAGATILPLLAIGGLAIATGGFGLAGAAAAEGMAGGMAAAEGLAGTLTVADTALLATETMTVADTALLAGETMTVADSAALAGQTMAGASSAAPLTAGIGTTAPGAFVSGSELAALGAPQGMLASTAPAAVSTAPAAIGTTAPTATVATMGPTSAAAPGMMPVVPAAPSSSLFPSLIGGSGSGALLTYGEAAGLGVSAASSAMQASNAQASAEAQQAALEQQRLATELDAETRARDNEDNLRGVLAAQSVMFGARGASQGGQTAARLVASAVGDANDQGDVIAAEELAMRADNGLRRAALRRSAKGELFGSGLQFGRDAWSVLSGRRAIG
ncbi:hypothetical protein [Magnetospirillum moscoviense]|uniref:Uncharacterized protein n=1 Tax=Magnetospirillum moscoviense TaxID=1437059 RepID=A0A178MPQ8_9PROT|nr:hypothetical protein [Magnetospirillum moscoviense]OAN50696.1 hypothetical protein A6A05_11870 [Magnetospirillum moscoviense]